MILPGGCSSEIYGKFSGIKFDQAKCNEFVFCYLVK